MIEAIIIQILLMLGLGSPGNAGMSPEAMYDAGLLRRQPPDCREPSAEEKQERGLGDKGKASTYSLAGVFVCERKLFDYGERDAYATFVLEQAPQRAMAAAREAARLIAVQPSLANKIWTVAVTAGPSALKSHLEQVYRQALSDTLGTARVARTAVPTVAGVEVAVIVHPAVDPALLFAVTAKTAEGANRRLWSL